MWWERHVRLACAQQSIGGDDWKGYSKEFIANLWQPSLVSYERLKGETMLLATHTAEIVRQAASKPYEDSR
jgi:hypothetical protein